MTFKNHTEHIFLITRLGYSSMEGIDMHGTTNIDVIALYIINRLLSSQEGNKLGTIYGLIFVRPKVLVAEIVTHNVYYTFIDAYLYDICMLYFSRAES